MVTPPREGQRSMLTAEPLYTGKEGDRDRHGCDVHREHGGESRRRGHGSQRETGTRVQY